MKGDFSRDTFDRQHHFTRVLMQQGRVLLDSDWNEQTSILLHYLRTLASDLIGPHGGPREGFKISCSDDLKCDFIIGRGHYYVDGILCENRPPLRCEAGDAPPPLTYNTQPEFPLGEDDKAKLRKGTSYLVYLHVWERHLTHIEAAHIREVALGGPDTATRARVICQVKAGKVPKDAPDDATCADLLGEIIGDRRRCLRARARVAAPSDDPCIIPPEARYRGVENQLYRVEIHDGGKGGAAKDGATFKWSRDNGSVAFAIRALQGSIATLDTLGPDQRRGLAEGDWVEIVDDDSVLRFAPRRLLRVASVDQVKYQVTLDVPSGVELPVFYEGSSTHPLLRRWDQQSDVLPVQEGKWIDLEDGVQIYFEPGGAYLGGDYWRIPARTAVGDVLWPSEQGPDGGHAPQALPPHGIEHHYAPLARLSVDGTGNVSCDDDCRCTFKPLCAEAAVAEPSEDVVSRVLFEANVFELSDAAREKLGSSIQPLTARLRENPALQAEVRGFASRDEDGPLQISEARAKRVFEFYAESGVPTQRLSVKGLGAADSESVPLESQRRVETVLLTGRTPDRPIRHPVEDVDGVGSTFLERLKAAGITDAATLARMQPAKLAEILSPPGGRAVSETTAAAIIENAKRLVAG